MAKEYIERDAALEVVNGWREQLIPTYGENDEYVKCLGEVAEHLYIIPAADVAPVVRCKDCKYGVPTKNGFLDDMIACENKDSPCGYSSWLCQPDWFCADGESRT